MKKRTYLGVPVMLTDALAVVYNDPASCNSLLLEELGFDTLEKKNVFLPIFEKWGQRITAVFMVAIKSGMPVRVFVTHSGHSEVEFAIQFAPGTCILEDRFPAEWVAQFTFRETLMSLTAHDMETIQHNTEWVTYDLPRDKFSIYCLATLQAMYMSCGKCTP